MIVREVLCSMLWLKWPTDKARIAALQLARGRAGALKCNQATSAARRCRTSRDVLRTLSEIAQRMASLRRFLTASDTAPQAPIRRREHRKDKACRLSASHKPRKLWLISPQQPLGRVLSNNRTDAPDLCIDNSGSSNARHY